jgi:ribonucleotide reductase alpha subunit
MKMDSILSEEFLEQYKGKQPKWGFNGLGYIVYKRTYSRKKEDGTTEEWWETVARSVNGAQGLGAQYTRKEAERLYDLVFNLKCSFAGRMLWQLGTPTVERFGANSLLNCWYVSIVKPEDFLFIFENLMLGGGVGFSVRREDIHELPRIKRDVKITQNQEKDADFIVPDSREGWVETLRKVLNAYFVTGKGFSYSTILVRGKGEAIGGFGGTASGPQILHEGLSNIAEILDGREGKKLRSIDVLDICNLIGSIVVSGNVRRSAEIALGDPDDYLFIRAKNWSGGKVPNWRKHSNNTIGADSFDHISPEIWNLGYVPDPSTGMAKGEPYGFFNLPLSQKYGRLKDPPRKDDCTGLNPCAEITLSSYECCNLVELFLNNIDSKEELWDCARLLYKTQKAIAAMPFIHEETNKIVHKNMRLGMGITGVCQSVDKIDWLDGCYNKLRKFDEKWSKQRGWPESIKLTTVKPSGTLSLLAGSSAGIHPAYSRYWIRRVQISSNDPLLKFCQDLGYNTEFLLRLDGTQDYSTHVVEFPCSANDGALIAEDVGIIDQLNLVKKIQSIWSDNSVSVTAYYTKGELEKIKEWMKENYKNSVKSISFLLKDDHGFKQAPYESIDEKKHASIIKRIKPLILTASDDIGEDTLDGLECEGGACPIK